MIVGKNLYNLGVILFVIYSVIFILFQTFIRNETLGLERISSSLLYKAVHPDFSEETFISPFTLFLQSFQYVLPDSHNMSHLI